MVWPCQIDIDQYVLTSGYLARLLHAARRSKPAFGAGGYFGSHEFPVLDGYSPRHLAILDLPFANQYEAILDEHLPAADLGDFLCENRVVSLRPGLTARPMR